MPHCSEAWDAISRYIYTGLQGGSIMKGWMKRENEMICCCSDGTRPVIFKIERIDEDQLLAMTQDISTYYVWIGGSCDYGHKERAGGAAVVIENNGNIISRDLISDLHTTEFRMMLTLIADCSYVNTKQSSHPFL